MRYLPLFIVAFPLLLTARENPFSPMPAIEIVKVKEQNVTASSAVKKLKTEIPLQRKSHTKEIVNYGKARFVFRENSAYIESKDDVINHFSITNPPSIIIDFKSPSDFASKRRALAVKPFIKLEMGAHADYYRVVLRLDKVHSYTVEKRKYGQFVTISD
ncbi:MAG: AMIN domain-containing protein [Thiovulaceae bacterium]|nr:AMIN domain-containing protein [Sulfurimonadaceae bacterium]